MARRASVCLGRLAVRSRTVNDKVFVPPGGLPEGARARMLDSTIVKVRRVEPGAHKGLCRDNVGDVGRTWR
jgi:hypothetical protein